MTTVGGCKSQTNLLGNSIDSPRSTMKKLAVLSLIAALACSAFGQGQINFINKVTSPSINAPIFEADGVTKLDGANPLYHAALLGGAAGSLGASINFATFVATAGNMALTFDPTSAFSVVGFRTGAAIGYVATAPNTFRVIPGVAYGGTAVVQEVVWKGNYSDWASAVAAWNAGTAGVEIGVSSVLTLVTSTSATDPAPPSMVGLNSFNLVPTNTPEPGTIALAGLGAATLLLFRRKK
jgi:hypothetical protein